MLSSTTVLQKAQLYSCQDMKTDTVLIALARFTARRGTFNFIHSDNENNFVGAIIDFQKRLKGFVQNEMKP